MSHTQALQAALDAESSDVKPTTPGVAARVFHGIDVIYEACRGAANLEHGVPLTPQSVAPLASVTKSFTATVTLAFVERGDPGFGSLVSLSPDRGWGRQRSRRLESAPASLGALLPDPQLTK